MAQLRKMLGELDDPSVIGLMRQIETQSKQTLAAWAADEVRTRMLPLLAGCADARPQAAIEAVEAWLAGAMALKALKPMLVDARKASQELTADPVQQAAARSIATACAVVTTPTNALGYTFYFAAACAYAQAGLSADKQTYDTLASQELARLLDTLKARSEEHAADPVRVNWGC